MPLRLELPSQLSVPASWSEATTFAADDPEFAAAIAYFRGVFGERWRGWERSAHVTRSFHTSLQNGPREWVRLFRLAQALCHVPHLELVVKDLGSVTWTKHVAAEQSLELCGRLRLAGYRVEFVQNTHETSPDTRIWLHDRPVTVEFKALHDPNEQLRWNAFEDNLLAGLMQRRARAGQEDWALLAARFEPPALEQVDAVVDTLSKIIEARNPIWSDLPGGAGSARFAALDDPERGHQLPVEQQDDLSRICSKLRSSWIEQFRSIDGPTLLVVLTEQMFVFPGESVVDEAQRVADELCEVLAKRRMLGGILLHEEPFLPPYAPVHARGEGWAFDMGGTEGRARSVLLVQNRAARAPLVTSELEPLVGAARAW